MRRSIIAQLRGIGTEFAFYRSHGLDLLEYYFVFRLARVNRCYDNKGKETKSGNQGQGCWKGCPLLYFWHVLQ